MGERVKRAIRKASPNIIPNIIRNSGEPYDDKIEYALWSRTDLDFFVLSELMRMCSKREVADNILLRASILRIRGDFASLYLLIDDALKKCSSKLFNIPRVGRLKEIYDKMRSLERGVGNEN